MSATNGVPGERRRSLGIALLAAALGVAVALASFLPAWRLADARLFDLVSTALPPEAASDIVVVAIDEPSFAEVGRQWPWPRSLHARLVEALRAAGARAIGLDLVFSEPSDPAEDAALAAALGPDTVLAADISLIETPQAAQVLRTEPLPALTAGGAASGLASVVLDGDGVLRRLPPYPDGLARRTIEAAGEPVPEPPEGALLAAAGPARTYPTVSYYQALDPAAFLPPGYFENRIVLVGLSLQTAPTIDAGGADSYATPFSTLTGRLLAGVEVQASIADNLRRGLAFTPLPAVVAAMLPLVAAFAGGLAVRRRTSGWTLFAAALGLAVIAATSVAALHLGRVWAAPFAPGVAFLAVIAGQSVRDHAAERRARRRVTRAFAHYLAPELVERLARDPAALKLGGERRCLSILFCDVRGFTTISERLKDEPERLTALINHLLDPLSEAVLANGGTIDKYIGDCVMAFWNAPLDDPDHAAHAVEAALAMVAAARRIRDELGEQRDAAGEPLPPIAVGVGVNTGDCVVGNMGSSTRFDYSVLGDAVNLASRLEGTSKTYGVPIVLGEETRRRLGAGFPIATLDHMAVRGRSTSSPIYTVLPGADADALAAHEALVADVQAERAEPDDPRFVELAARLPALAVTYEVLKARLVP